MTARWLVLVGLLVITVVLAPPALIGMQLRGFISPWMVGAVNMADAGVLRARLIDDGWFSTRVAVTLEGGATSGLGEIHFEHSPMTWTTGVEAVHINRTGDNATSPGTERWPGYVRGEGHIEINGALFGGLLDLQRQPARITAKLAAGAPATINSVLQIPAGFLQLHGARIELTQARFALRTDLLAPEQPVPFSAQLRTNHGVLDADGEVDQATGRWHLTAHMSITLVHHVMTTLLLAELSSSSNTQPDAQAVSTLAARRVEALITLGYLQQRDGKLFTEATLGESGMEVFGAPVALWLPTSGASARRQ